MFGKAEAPRSSESAVAVVVDFIAHASDGLWSWRSLCIYARALIEAYDASCCPSVCAAPGNGQQEPHERHEEQNGICENPGKAISRFDA
jgi:hypothetical protein